MNSIQDRESDTHSKAEFFIKNFKQQDDSSDESDDSDEPSDISRFVKNLSIVPGSLVTSSYPCERFGEPSMILLCSSVGLGNS